MALPVGDLVYVITIFILFFKVVTRIDVPTEIDPTTMGLEKSVTEPGFITCNNNWLYENEFGLWEMYLEGGPLELGALHGLLAEQLVQKQEDAFVNQIKVMIPSESYLKFLKYFIGWFNKDLDEYIKHEYLLEIYGVSAFASENYGFIGPKYNRILNYHAAHDIGHALQNLSLVECTAFGVWDEMSSDSGLLIGRNFDFYVGDEFAENKIIAFIDPEDGYKFASVTWAGMIGVVSGMNEKGLTISLNSAKSEIPFGARTPVSIIAREILQYASTIEEAIAIASARKSFVSESFLIGSAIDHKSVVIEKSTDTTVLFDPGYNHIILTNHFQSDYFMKDELNIENIENETSLYRHERVQEMLAENMRIDHSLAADILRDRRGKGDRNIGNGNEKAINQLIAHHSIIFKPESLQLWISTSPWQVGEYLCYDLDSIFKSPGIRDTQNILYNSSLQIPADSFLTDDEYLDFINFKTLLGEVQAATRDGIELTDEQDIINELVQSNPEYFHIYFAIGKYYESRGNLELATKYFNLAMSKEVASSSEKEKIQQAIKDCLTE